jgi:endonuclease-3
MGKTGTVINPSLWSSWRPTALDRDTALAIFDTLAEHYSDVWARERYSRPPFQVLITTILSAQTTDRAVDAVRDVLFSTFPGPEALAAANPSEVEEIIRTTGFYRMKARNIIRAARVLVDQFGGEVPRTMDELLTIPGVGRKTANIVLYHGFGTNEGVAVDTHVFRLARRIGLSSGKDAGKVEQDLMALFPRERWGVLTDLLIAHGRALCTARKPACPVCPIRNRCRYYEQVYLPGLAGA